MARLIDITGKAVSGEWGFDDETGDGIPVIRTTNFTNDGVVNYNDIVTRKIIKKNLDEKYLRKGDIIIEKSGGSDKFPVGRVIYFDGEENTYLFNNFTGLLRVKNQELWYTKYVFYSLFFNYKRGGTRAFENKTTGLHNLKTDEYVRRYEVTERSRNEQILICEKLDRAYSIIKSRQLELLLLDELIKARFVEMFGDPEQNEKGWRTCRLGDECTVINGRAYKAEELLDEGKYRVLRVGNFFTNDSWYYSDLELDNEKYCDEGDLLFAWSASFGPRIWHGEKVIYHYHIWKLIGYENCLNKDFFVELLNYNCDVMKRGTHGSTMLHFTKSQMEDQLLILPPMQLQEQFADFVHQVDKSKVAVQKALDETQILFDSLMQKYFG